MFYRIPDVETEIFIEPDNGNNLIRTLGGLRLKYEYYVPFGAILSEITWNFNAPGRFCLDYGVDATGCTDLTGAGGGSLDYGGTGAQAEARRVVYWEPVDSAPAGNPTLWSNSFTTEDNVVDPGTALLTVRYTIDGVETTEQIPFTVSTRELRPLAPDPANPQAPMNGSDVEMLEAMLWGLGISPQYGFPGKSGDRIDQIAPDGSMILAQPRDEFSTGYQYMPVGSSLPRSQKAVGSMAMMAHRFKSRSFETTQAGIEGQNSQNANIDDATLSQLAVVWRDYFNAVDSIADDEFVLSDITTTQWTALEGAMVGNVSFVLPVNSLQIPLRYPDATHTSAMRATGNNPTTKRDLLRAWVSKENTMHWGAGNTPYRISEGSADEVGSFGFNQLWFAYAYGQRTNCNQFNDVNLYHPENNLLGFAVWSGVTQCGGSMYRAFHTNRYVVQNALVTANRLVGYTCTEDSSGNPVTNGICTYAPDNYERLLKGLIGYNAGANAARLRDCSIPEMLAGGVTRNGTNCQSTRVNGEGLDYGLTILHGTVPPAPTDPNKLSLPYRSFIWVGARYPAIDPVTGQPHPQAGQPEWCFAYGEEEWRNPALHPLTQRPMGWIAYRDVARVDLNRRTNCN